MKRKWILFWGLVGGVSGFHLLYVMDHPLCSDWVLLLTPLTILLFAIGCAVIYTPAPRRFRK